jgi:hypothetical protein
MEIIVPGKVKSYSDLGKDDSQEAAIMYNKESKGKISKDALKRRLVKIYSRKER